MGNTFSAVAFVSSLIAMSLASSSESGGSLESIEGLLEQMLMMTDNVVSATSNGEEGILLTRNALTGRQAIYTFDNDALAGLNLQPQPLPPPPPAEAPDLVCNPAISIATGGGLNRVLAYISGATGRLDVELDSNQDISQQGILDTDYVINQIFFFCDEALMGVTQSGMVLLLEDLDEPEVIGQLPAYAGGPVTYDSYSGYITTVENSGEASMLVEYSLSGDCEFEVARMNVIQAANQCADGDITAIESIGGSLFSVACSVPDGTAQQRATLVNINPIEDTPRIIGPSADGPLDLFTELTDDITGFIPVSLDGTALCDNSAQTQQCIDLDACEEQDN